MVAHKLEKEFDRLGLNYIILGDFNETNTTNCPGVVTPTFADHNGPRALDGIYSNMPIPHLRFTPTCSDHALLEALIDAKPKRHLNYFESKRSLAKDAKWVGDVHGYD
jgi:hypothetical protein